MKLTEKQIKQIRTLGINRSFYKGRLSEREIAKKIGCSRSAVWYWLNK